MTVKPGETAMPQPNADGGAKPQPNGDQVPENGGQTAPGPSVEDFRKSIGLKDGQDISNVVVNASRPVIQKELAKALEPITKQMEALAASLAESKAEKVETTKKVEDAQSVKKEFQEALRTRDQEMLDLRGELKGKEKNAAFAEAVADLNLDPKLANSFRKLAADGELDGFAQKPKLNDNGELVVENKAGEEVPFRSAIDQYVKDNTHWLARQVVRGSDIQGNDAPAPASTYDFDPTNHQASAEAYKTDGAKHTEQIQGTIDSLHKQVYGS